MENSVSGASLHLVPSVKIEFKCINRGEILEKTSSDGDQSSSEEKDRSPLRASKARSVPGVSNRFKKVKILKPIPEEELSDSLPL